MHQNNILFLSLFIFVISSCGGGGSSAAAPQQNSTTPTPAPAPAPSPASVTSNLIAHAKGTVNGNMSYKGIDREFILYVPSSYESSAKQPLVFNFHGYGSNANEQMNYGDLRSQADANGFILVHPEALDDIAGTSYWNMGGWSISVHDDLEFIDNLINLLMDKYSVNAERIYSTGMSNGGFFSFHLACNLNTSFAAIASVTGSMSYDTFNSCNARKPTPIMQIHGSIDTVVPYSGIETVMKPVMEVMEYWKINNSCDDFILALPGILPGTTSWTETYLFDNCLNGTQNIHLYVQGAGHIWPGSIYERINDPNSSQRIWNFFEKFDTNGLIAEFSLPTGNADITPSTETDSEIIPNEGSNQGDGENTDTDSDTAPSEVLLEPLPLGISSNLEPQVSGTINGEISYNDINREFILYVPSSYDPNTRQPLVFNFHGYTSSANEHLHYGDMRAQADQSGFILVYPDALNDIKGKSYWNMGGWSQSDHNDIEFIENLIHLLKNNYPIDSQRIYTSGFSNGGFFSFHLACNLKDTFAAVASIAGSMSLETLSTCNPKKPTPILQIHGSDDTIIPYSGNTVLGVENAMKTIMEVMDYWKINNQCDEYILSNDVTTNGSSTKTDIYQYSNCLNETENSHIFVHGGGHIWFGAESVQIKEPNASKKIWDFFLKYDINGVIQ